VRHRCCSLYDTQDGTAAVPRFFDEPTVVPDFATVDDAENFLVEITRRVGFGELDVQAGLDLSSMTKNWINAKYGREELQIKLAAQGGGSDQHITISGGLPNLPGCNIIGLGGEEPPRMNGHNGPVIEHANADAPALTESANSEAQEPEQP
jgi:hypothetical protein